MLFHSPVFLLVFLPLFLVADLGLCRVRSLRLCRRLRFLWRWWWWRGRFGRPQILVGQHSRRLLDRKVVRRGFQIESLELNPQASLVPLPERLRQVRVHGGCRSLHDDRGTAPIARPWSIATTS